MFSSIFLAAIFLPLFSYAYSQQTTHPALTDEIVDFFNFSYTDALLSADEKRFLIEGSTEEDSPETRVVNHFYDPVRNVGLKTFGGLTAKNWAENTRAQAVFSNLAGIGFISGLFSAESDYSWERAIYEYAHGSSERGLRGLGHILHLIEDMTVPPHVRDDAHPPAFDFGSPYEKWTARFTPENTDIAMNLIAAQRKPIILPTLSDYFDVIAHFTNENFFSKDTIFDEKYNQPNIIKQYKKLLSDGQYHIFGQSYLNEEQYTLVEIQPIFDFDRGEFLNIYTIKDPDYIVISDYWSVLSRQAVLHGAGVMKLFFDEVERERETFALYEKNKSFFAKVRGNIASVFAKVRENIAGVFGASNVSGIGEGSVPAEQSDGGASADLTEAHELAAVLAVLEENAALLARSVAVAQARDGDIAQSESAEAGDMEDVPLPDGVAGDGLDDAAEGQDTSGGFVWVPKATTLYPGFGGGGGVSTALGKKGTVELELEPESADESDFEPDQEPAEEPEPAAEPEPEPSAEPDPEPEPELDPDTTPPDTPELFVAGCEDFLSDDACLVIGTEFLASWTKPADTDYFLLTIDGVVASTIATSTTVSVADGETTVLSIAAYDASGNLSSAVSKTVVTNRMPIVINEIAWMGTGASSADEWIELKNRTNRAISFDSGAWFLRATDGAPSTPLSGIIPAGGYYLIERTDDDTVSDISADLVTPFSGSGGSSGLSNTGEVLVLERVSGVATTTIDKTPDCGGWCFGNLSRKRTMERYDENASGADTANWGTALGEFIRNGSDARGVPISGTPKSRNSISYQIANGAVLASDKTLTQAHSPYIIGRNGLTISAGATLSLEPGTVVKLVNLGSPSLAVDGALVAAGTDAMPVVFTSFLDDTYSGDTNGDGLCDVGNASSTASCPVAGVWGRIHLRGPAGASSFTHTFIRYGGAWFTGIPGTYRAVVVDDGADATFDFVMIEYSGGHGLSMVSSEGSVAHSTFRYNKKDGESAGMFVAGGAPAISGSEFSDNTYGIRISGSGGLVSGNTFIGNVTAVRADGLPGGFSGNVGSGNITNGINLSDSIATVGATTTLGANGLPYLIKITDASVPAGSALVVESGATLKFQGRRLIVSGHMQVAGVASTPVVFTSAFDDSDGNDATGNGASVGTVSGMQGIVLEPGSSSSISDAEFRFMHTALSYLDSPITLADVRFVNNRLAVAANAKTLAHTIIVSGVTFEDNVSTTSPSGLW
ncbi:MAG: hypothetical protein COW88_00275 [Candidatus Lloydbacteria bacterium CG22_combo_CG10-13_8_21_14_all_47_15]|uniref:LTD domain-containing protein n=1 Tax=Candidatus Lloydbacteria bacterium CG22_combo_CG10-13_8_21_14_all_47_15 TaxID=1974635 RepID=A0A2H0CX61_9BACT|nr:MAG: hypothetical protein COW88_00275 [Candidatus Lloydbacteria bacterium CG22_combo_CG10-13_8_21_14_all_47_15]